MPTADIPSAARRVAADIRRESAAPDGMNHWCAYTPLLPVLDAVAAGQDEDRVERMAETICRANCRRAAHPCDTGRDGDCLPGKCPRRFAMKSEARAALALADAERAADVADGWRPISDTPPSDTEGDVWCDFGDGLSGRIADCLFDGTRWIRQEVPFCDWTPAPSPLAWMPKPVAPTLDAAVRRLAGLDPTDAPPR